MTLIGLDLNATRARAIQGANAGAGPHVPIGLALEGNQRELPLALSLEERQPRVGRVGASLCRRLPHFACLDFLPHLGDERVWNSGRHRLDAASALALVCEHLQRRIGRAQGVTAAVPAYLSVAQTALLAHLAGKAKWRLLGSVPSPLAVALAAHEHLPWSGQAVIVDVDGHALTFSTVAVRNDLVRVLHVHAIPRLSRNVWLCRLLDRAAVRCIHLSRRDPRESAETEQALFDRLAAVLDTEGSQDSVEMVLQTPHWYQHLQFAPVELSALCAPLVQQTLAEMQQFLADITPPGAGGDKRGVGAVLLTGAAARLPGLAAAVDELILRPDAAPPFEEESADFGEDLIDENMLSARVHVLDDDAVARAAFDLALRQHRGELPRGHLDCATLPGSSADAAGDRGPARLHYRGEDHVLSAPVFALGRDPACQLVFEGELYPTVSARHCEIVLTRGAYLLRDRSRHGTLVNDCLVTQPAVLHSGDWIRLGSDGPLLRFLGQPSDQRRLTTA
ncbi:MAG: FHA domain-containing protein [Gemmataceae bacterium]